MKEYRLCLIFRTNKTFSEKQMKEEFLKIKNREEAEKNLYATSEEKRKIFMHPRDVNIQEEFWHFEEVKN